MEELETYEFILPDGSKRMLTVMQARSFGCKHMIKRANEIVDSINSKNKKKHKKDGFVPGWQENIMCNAWSYGEYQRILKQNGLIELGNETAPIKDATTTGGYYNDEFFKSAHDAGIYISGKEEEAMRSGDYFKKNIDTNQ